MVANSARFADHLVKGMFLFRNIPLTLERCRREGGLHFRVAWDMLRKWKHYATGAWFQIYSLIDLNRRYLRMLMVSVLDNTVGRGYIISVR